MKSTSGFRQFLKNFPLLKKLGGLVSNEPMSLSSQFAPPGHFYSPIPDLSEIEKQKSRIYSDALCNETIGIDLQQQQQKDLLLTFREYQGACPFFDSKQQLRYKKENNYFSVCSAFLLYCILIHTRPRRVVEIGSGFSSAAMLDVNQRCSLGIQNFTFVDPYPDRLLTLLNPDDKKTCRVISTKVQEVPKTVFDTLDAQDLLFIDSSHVAKSGSDVVHLFTEVIPMLKPGVMVHIHDIYWPFEYPIDWLRKGICWNEAYIVKSFLQYNDKFRIFLFNDFCFRKLKQDLEACIQIPITNAGSSLFFQRLS
jgi:hypothetical protein